MSAQDFIVLLKNMMSNDNTVRQQAENVWNQTKTSHPNQVITTLLQVGREFEDVDVRNFCFIMLRRALLAPTEKLWYKLDPQTKSLIKQQLLNGVEKESHNAVRSSICDVTYELAEEIFSENEDTWDEFFNWILHISVSPDPNLREAGLIIIAKTADFLVVPFESKFQILKNILVAGLGDVQNIQVRVAAVECVEFMANAFVEQPQRGELQSLIPHILELIAWTLNNQDEDNTENAMKIMIEFAETDPGFFKPFLPQIFDAMLKIANAGLEDSIRQLAAEYLAAMVQNKPKLCRQVPNFVQNLIGTLLKMMLEIEDLDLEDWNKQEDDEDDLDIHNNVVAQEHLDRVCMALGGEIIVPIIFEHIPALIANKQDWKHRHVGLMALSMIGEGCKDFLMPHLDKIMMMVLSTFEDEHPRVRWAAVNTIGQMSTDFGPKLQKHFHQQVIAGFAKLMEDVQNPKVQAHTSAAIINFCEKFDASLLQPYLPVLLQRLLALMNSSVSNVQEQAITAVASIAGCAQKMFYDYYDTFVPTLMTKLSQPFSKEQRALRGKIMECISLIGIAVGKEKFLKDANQLMEILDKLQNTVPMDADDPQKEYMMQTWTRISTCLGEHFVPYLKYVMPPLLKNAAIDAGIHVADYNDDEQAAEEQGWEFIEIGNATKIAIHTTALDEKCSSCNMLYCYASEMKDGFFPYVEETSKLMVPLLGFPYHDGVRMAALSTMPALLESTKLYLEKSNQPKDLLMQLFSFVFPPMIEEIKNESDPEVLSVGLEALYESLEVMGYGTLSSERVKEVMELMKQVIEACRDRRKKLLSDNPDQDDDEATFVAREEIGKEEECLTEVAEVIGQVVKHHPELFFVNFSTLAELTMSMLPSTSPAAERQLAVCIFDDMVEHLKDKSIFLFPHFVPLMLEYAKDTHPGVRQAAVYGLGVCAQHGGDVYKPFVPKTLETLVNVITGQDAKQEHFVTPTENAISSVGKVIQFQPDVIASELSNITDMWVSWLPLEVDTVEAVVVHKQLCHFIRSNNTHILGQNYKNLPKIMDIFATIYDTELADAETKKQISEILRQMQAGMPGLLMQALTTLSPVNQQKLNVAIQANI